jgi:integrase
MSIHTRITSSGQRRHEVRLRDPADREYSRTFRTKQDAERFQTTERADRSRGLWVDPRKSETTFAAWATIWLTSDPNKRPKSLVTDETIIRLHLNPAIGTRPLATITPVDLQRLVAKWSAGCAPSSTRRRFATLRAILTAAVDAELLGRSPCRKTKLPADLPNPRHVVTPDELHRLAEAIGPDYAAMVYLGAVLGLRIGECAALRVGRLDLLRGTLTVAESVAEVHGRLVYGKPKSDAGRRTITMPTGLVSIVAEHLVRRGLTAADSDALVFGSPTGSPVRPTNWRQRQWIPAINAVGLEGLRFHDLRKAAATAMVASGVDVRTAQSRLGHADPLLTLAVYAQTTNDADRSAADRLGAHFLCGPAITARDGRGMKRSGG